MIIEFLEKHSQTDYTITIPPFEDYFKYLSLVQGKDNTFLGDDFLLQNYVSPVPSDSTLKLRARMALLNHFNPEGDFSELESFEYLGHRFEFLDPEGNYMYTLRTNIAKNKAQGIRKGFDKCYLVDGEPITKKYSELNYLHAGALTINLSSFFT